MLLLDSGIQNLLSLRISDSSTVTREAAVDLLLLFLNGSHTDTDAFIDYYLPLVLARSADRSQMVRKKVTLILSAVLSVCNEKHYDRVVHELV